MEGRVCKLLEDMRRSAAEIQHDVAGLDERHYGAVRLIQKSVEREFEIIGEAMRRLRSESPEWARRLNHCDEIVAFRNVLAHGYDAVDNSRVWNIIVTHLPLLLTEVEALLPEAEAQSA
jgi:uncharacterized protein with HEPN domain